jgi:hypothetical protein
MKNVTIKQIIARRGDISAKLIRATVKQFGGIEALNECAQDVNNHGIHGGFHGFIYYSDTCSFFAKHQRDIVAFAKETAREFDTGLLEMVRDFGGIRGDYSVDEIGLTLFGTKKNHDTQIANVMAWFIGEEIARAVADIQEDY